MDFENRREDGVEEDTETLTEALEDAEEPNEAAENAAEDDLEKSEAEESDKEEKKPPFFDSVFNWIELFSIYFSIGILVILCLFGHSYVDGDSMMETLHDNDILLFSKLPYTPEYGDIIVCQSTESYGLEKPLVKRVIATSGQEVTIDYVNWKVTVDGVTLDEEYIRFEEGKIMNPSNYLFETFTVPDGKVFVMGDNRNYSLDSRSAVIGFIDERYILGRVTVRLYPFSDFEIF